MAKAFLVRWGRQIDFDSIKLSSRELGLAVDTVKLLIGTEDGNLHIPNEDFVKDMISSSLESRSLLYGTTIELQTKQLPGILAYDSDKKKIIYSTPDGSGVINVANEASLPLSRAISVKIEAANIDVNDSNSVTLAGYTRPVEMVFLNGMLCTTNASDLRRYAVDRVAHTLKVYGCAENDIVAYF